MEDATKLLIEQIETLDREINFHGRELARLKTARKNLAAALKALGGNPPVDKKEKRTKRGRPPSDHKLLDTVFEIIKRAGETGITKSEILNQLEQDPAEVSTNIGTFANVLTQLVDENQVQRIRHGTYAVVRTPKP